MKVKTMHAIFSQFRSDFPLLAKKLELAREIERFKIAFLTPIERGALEFIILKDQRLLLAFKHPALCVEFNHYKHKYIMKCLRQYSDRFPLLSAANALHAYVPSHILRPINRQIPKSIKILKEHSDGNFENLATNPVIFDKIEALRAGIKRIYEHQNRS